MDERKPRKTVEILRINTDGTTMAGVLRQTISSLEKKQKIFITTPNPEIILKSTTDEILRKAINDSDIKVPDGIGLAAATRFLQMKKFNNPLLAAFIYLFQGALVGIRVITSPASLKNDLQIIKGRSLFLELIKTANKKRQKVFLLGGLEDASCKARDELLKNYKSVQIECSAGPVLNKSAVPINHGEKYKEKQSIKDINNFKPQFLFVAFGAPKQEKWVDKWKENLNANVIMVVGGAFDYYAGKIALPPKWVEERSLEWLWRLIKQPQRVVRIFNAVIRFSWKVYLYKINN